MRNSDSTILPPTDQLLDLMNRAAHLVRDLSLCDYLVHHKSDGSPVTEVDLACHDFLTSELGGLSRAPIISEEDQVHPAIDPTQPFWLLDPLDGTRDFIGGTGECSINLALIEGGRPVWGAVSEPLAHKLYWAEANAGSFVVRDGGGTEKLTTRSPDEKFRYVVSRRYSQENEAKFRERFPHGEIVRLGSALKLCRIAEGAADLALRRSPMFEWDSAAGVLLVQEAGGICSGLKGDALTYGELEKWLHPNFIACGNQRLYSNVLEIYSRR